MKKIVIVIIVLVCYFQKYEFVSLDQYRSEEIKVEIKGAVKKPNVYHLPYEANINDLIKQAGGLNQNADTETINLNKQLHHQDVIVIKTKTAIETRISLNSASLEQLTQIKGIGPSTASKIIEYRSVHGSFQTIEDIMNVKGIKQKLFDKIKEYLIL